MSSQPQIGCFSFSNIKCWMSWLSKTQHLKSQSKCLVGFETCFLHITKKRIKLRMLIISINIIECLVCRFVFPFHPYLYAANSCFWPSPHLAINMWWWPCLRQHRHGKRLMRQFSHHRMVCVSIVVSPPPAYVCRTQLLMGDATCCHKHLSWDCHSFLIFTLWHQHQHQQNNNNKNNNNKTTTTKQQQ